MYSDFIKETCIIRPNIEAWCCNLMSKVDPLSFGSNGCLKILFYYLISRSKQVVAPLKHQIGPLLIRQVGIYFYLYWMACDENRGCIRSRLVQCQIELLNCTNCETWGKLDSDLQLAQVAHAISSVLFYYGKVYGWGITFSDILIKWILSKTSKVCQFCPF
jgi:hypothetical protein